MIFSKHVTASKYVLKFPVNQDILMECVEIITLAYSGQKLDDKILLEECRQAAEAILSLKGISDKNIIENTAKIVFEICKDGFGIVSLLLKDKELEEISIDGINKPIVVRHRKHSNIKTNLRIRSEAEFNKLVEAFGKACGREFTPYVSGIYDGYLPDGSRVSITTGSISKSISIRLFTSDPLTPVDLIKLGTIGSDAMAFLSIIVDGLYVKPANILVIGGTKSGKTTLLNALTMFIPDKRRIVVIEDVAELQLPKIHKNCLRLVTTKNITLLDLLKNTLRRAPDSIIVGEVRGEEAISLTQAMLTGHEGSMGTLHANDAKAAVQRLTSPPMNVPLEQIADAIDYVVRIWYNPTKNERKVVSAEYIYREGKEIKFEKNLQYDPRSDSWEVTLSSNEYIESLLSFARITKEEAYSIFEERKNWFEKKINEPRKNMKELRVEWLKFNERLLGLENLVL